MPMEVRLEFSCVITVLAIFSLNFCKLCVHVYVCERRYMYKTHYRANQMVIIVSNIHYKTSNTSCGGTSKNTQTRKQFIEV